MRTDQAVQLRDRSLHVGMIYVPHLHTALAAGVDKLGGRGNGDRTDDLAVGECVDLASMPGNASAVECVRRKVHRVHLVLCSDVK